MEDDLGIYKYQLEGVLESLQSDPENQELLDLKNDIEEAIRLMSELDDGVDAKRSKREENILESQEEGAIEWNLGDICMHRTSSGSLLEATVTSLSLNRKTLTIIINKTQETKQVSVDSVHHTLATSNPRRPKTNQKALLEKKRKRAQSRIDYINKKESEHKERADAWKDFRSKLCHKPSPSLFKSRMVGKKSMFKAPESGGGKIGIVNSGKPMTRCPVKTKYVHKRHSHSDED